MSFQDKTDMEIESALVEKFSTQASLFEYHIMQCCKAPEWELRKWLKKVLTRSGFEIYEDQYVSDRVKKDKRYETVHNMLAIRGEANVCLVSHTDVCRDHDERGYYTESSWMQNKDDVVIKRELKKVEPVIRNIEHEGVLRRVIQDKNTNLQVGGDDRLGVAIITWIALNTGYPLGLYFPTDEEIGLRSARACDFPQLNNFDLLVEVDRGNHSDELVTKISGEILCSYETGARLLEIAYDMGKPRAPVTGFATDVYALKQRNKCREAVNMTCGYHHSIGSSPLEYIDVKEARDTLMYVSEIVKSYYIYGGNK